MIVTRFAPSPTGYLHRGHAFSALSAWTEAAARDGRFLLRIEDIDTVRCRPEYEAAVVEDLSWLGLSWEQPVRRQSEHHADYRHALDRLHSAGLLYRCFKTRREILDEISRAPHHVGEGPEGVIYTGSALPPGQEAERLARGDPFAWRLSLERAKERLGGWAGLSYVEQGENAGVWTAEPERLGDVVLARKDLGVAYHLAVVVDDALQGITHVVRGVDLAHAVHVQRVLQALLELPTPTYRHHPLLVGADGRRFAKRDRSETLRSLREAGVPPNRIRAELGFA